MVEKIIISPKRILLIGPFPPPYGGVSVHINRFTSLLKDNFSFDFIDESPIKKKEIFNLRSFQPLLYIKNILKADIIYIHSGKTILRLFHLIIGKILFKKTVLVLHGFTSKPPKFIFFFLGTLYRLANIVIAVNEDIRIRLHLPEENCIIKEAFIPPYINDEPELPAYINEAIAKNKNEGKIIICANAFRLETFQNEDLYGLDLCIEVSKRLRDKKKSFIFIFVVASTDENDEMYKNYQKRIEYLNLNHTFLLISTNLSFVKLIQHADIIVRPTNTDGDSLSIREGIFLNKRVLTSDVVERPSGSVLFQNRNIDDLEKQLEKLIEETISFNQNITPISHSKREDLRIFYSKLLNGL